MGLHEEHVFARRMTPWVSFFCGCHPSFDPICSSFSVLTSCKIADHPQIFIYWESRILRKTQEKRRRRQPPFCGRALRRVMAEEAVLPFEVLENVKQLNGPVMELELQLRVLLKSCRRQSLSLLTPVERASTFLCLSKALTTLFSCMLVIHSYFSILLLFPQTIACSFLCSEAFFGPSGN